MEINVLNYRKKILSKISMQINNHQKILDIGCGDGGDCELLSENAKEVMGIDIELHPNWTEIQKRKCNVDFQVADACNLPFPDDVFDIVFEKDVLHHIQNHKKALKEIVRVTKTGGRVIIVEANRYNPIFYLHMTLMKGHQHFTPHYLKQLIASLYKEDATFISAESRVYPIKSRPILRLIHIVEDLLERMPLVNNYLCYNIAVVKKVGESDG